LLLRTTGADCTTCDEFPTSSVSSDRTRMTIAKSIAAAATIQGSLFLGSTDQSLRVI
jgi:hypothetical protein